jgi:hypothetical protein
MRFVVPGAVSAEHHELHVRLSEAARLDGPVGDAARTVERLLQPHIAREERFALPPLALLKAAAEGAVSAEMADVFELTDELSRELPRLAAEHQEIVGALLVFSELAGRDGRTECVHFAERLIQHLRTEEAVLYPAAVLVGRYLKVVLPRLAEERASR